MSQRRSRGGNEIGSRDLVDDDLKYKYRMCRMIIMLCDFTSCKEISDNLSIHWGEREVEKWCIFWIDSDGYVCVWMDHGWVRMGLYQWKTFNFRCTEANRWFEKHWKYHPWSIHNHPYTSKPIRPICTPLRFLSFVKILQFEFF